MGGFWHTAVCIFWRTYIALKGFYFGTCICNSYTHWLNAYRAYEIIYSAFDHANHIILPIEIRAHLASYIYYIKL